MLSGSTIPMSTRFSISSFLSLSLSLERIAKIKSMSQLFMRNKKVSDVSIAQKAFQDKRNKKYGTGQPAACKSLDSLHNTLHKNTYRRVRNGCAFAAGGSL